MIAAVSLGLYPTMADCVKEWVSPYQRAAEPVDSALADVYAKAFPAYQQSRLALSPVWHATATQQDASE